jgi:hypothetical protein
VFKSLPPLQDILLEHEVHRALMRSHQRRFVMNKLHVWSGVACVSVFLATGALGEILGVQPGTSDNPKDNVPQEIQRSTPGGGSFGPGGTGPGTRSDALTGGMEKEKPESVTRRGLGKNAETGGGAALAAEDLKEKSLNKSTKGMKRTHRGTPGAATPANDGPKTNRQMFRQQNSDKSAHGQQLINEQPLDKQQAANRPGRERSGIQK